MKLKELLKKLRGEIKSLAEKPELTEDEAKELEELMTKAKNVKTQIKALADVVDGEVDEEAEKKKEFDAAVAKAVKEEKEKVAKGNRLPDKEGNLETPVIAKHSDLWKYDNLDAADQAFMVGLMHEGAKSGRAPAVKEAAYKALAVKLEGDKSRVGEIGRQAMKASNIKSDELNYATQATYGDEWVGVAYSQAIWDAIRVGTFVANKLPSIEIPQGHESIVLPLESSDPTFYQVAEATDHDSTMLFPVATVTSSKLATAQKTLSLGKLGARVPWSGELAEDSLIPWVAQLRKQLQVAGQENLESLIIDGDSTTTASTNINDIGDASSQANTEVYLVLDGFRKSPLVTTTANSRDGGVFTISDFLETVKLMGTGGINALDRSKVAFIMDVNTHWKSLELSEVLTRDVFAQPTLEGGKLTGIFGFDNYVSGQMHFHSAKRMANTAGKVHATDTNNTKGALLAVRWDQWLLGYRRRMTMEVTRYPRSDSNEITLLMRLGLAQRDTEASSISYNLTV